MGIHSVPRVNPRSGVPRPSQGKTQENNDAKYGSPSAADLVLVNGNITTMDNGLAAASGVAIQDGRFSYVGSDQGAKRYIGPRTRVVDAVGRCVIPGLNDSHLHLVRAGLNYGMEVRWDGVRSLRAGLAMLREECAKSPPGQWVRVVGGWSEFQFEERRMPTLDEINEVSPETPVFVLHLYHCVLLNQAAVNAAGFTRDTPDPPGAHIARDGRGEPTGWLVATPNANLLYSTLAKAPKLSPTDQAASTLLFMREMNRLGMTSCSDAGGGFQNYPEDYAIIEQLHRDGQTTVRVAFSLFTQHPLKELEDFQKWTATTKPGQGDEWLRHNGAGEMLVYSGADFENFLEPRPDLPSKMEQELHAVVSLLVQKRWPFRLHATYDESISRFLDVFERVDRETKFDSLRWWLDHCETISERSIGRIKALGGGIAIQHRLAYQGEHFTQRYPGKQQNAPPFAAILRSGVPLSLGTDATRVASYNPWIALQWAVTGQTVGGAKTRSREDLLTRETALSLMTREAAWFSGETGKKGQVKVGQLGDLAVLDADYFAVPEAAISRIQSVLTIVGGRIVHGTGTYASLAPPLPKISHHLPGATPPRSEPTPLAVLAGLADGC
jgi:predicted amidohydrolase YtcJ